MLNVKKLGTWVVIRSGFLSLKLRMDVKHRRFRAITQATGCTLGGCRKPQEHENPEFQVSSAGTGSCQHACKPPRKVRRSSKDVSRQGIFRN